jgi:hypothetical protein
MIIGQSEDCYLIKCSCGGIYDSALGANCTIVNDSSYPECPFCTRVEGVAHQDLTIDLIKVRCSVCDKRKASMWANNGQNDYQVCLDCQNQIENNLLEMT